MARLLTILALCSGTLLLLAGFIPFSWLQPLGTMIRRPDDVTPERYARYVQLCLFLGAGFFMTGVLMRTGRARVRAFLVDLGGELRSGIARRSGLGTSLRSSWAEQRLAFFVLALILIAGMAVRLLRIDQPMAYDEAYSFLNFARRPIHEALSDYNSTNNHLFNTFLMHGSYRLFGQNEWALRLGVFSAGALLLVLMYPWARSRCGAGTALLATALLAGMPAVIAYTTDARGYMYITCFAVLMDLAFDGIDRDRPFKNLRWCVAWLALVLGFWTMPIMIYPAAGVAGWYLLPPLFESPAEGQRTFRERLRQLAVFGALGGLATLVLYAPAYLFRGLQAFRQPMTEALGFVEVLRQTPSAWSEAFGWWTEGVIPGWAWGLAGIAGVMSLSARPDLLRRVAAPVVATFVIMLLQQVAPPPRLFLFLTPWFALFVAAGVMAGLRLLASWRASRLAKRAAPAPPLTKGGQGGATSRQRSAMRSQPPPAPPLERRGAIEGRGELTRAIGVALALVAVTGWYAVSRPVLFNAEERAIYLSIPAAIARFESDYDPAHGPARLYAPLPADLPSIYYMVARGFELPVNGPPAQDELIWLITEPGQEPRHTLSTPLVNLPEWDERLMPWVRVDEYPTATLWRSRGWPRSGSDPE